MISVTLSAITTTERKRECPLPFPGKKPRQTISALMCAGVLRGGFLHTTGERGEGYIAYKLPKQKLGVRTLWPIAKGMLRNSSLKRLVHFAMAIKRGGVPLQDRMDKEKKPYIFVGLVCVREQYQDRAICARLWILPLPRATGWACR